MYLPKEYEIAALLKPPGEVRSSVSVFLAHISPLLLRRTRVPSPPTRAQSCWADSINRFA